MPSAYVKIFIVAVSLALDVFAVSVGIGIRGVTTKAKFQIGASFAAAEVGMTVIGMALGATADRVLGGLAGYVGFAALVFVGAYMIVESVRESESGLDLSHGWGLLVGALSISLDSLGIGFSIVYIGVPTPIALVAIAVAAVSATVLGLGFGRLLGARVGGNAAPIAGVILILTGLTFAAEKYFGWS